MNTIRTIQYLGSKVKLSDQIFEIMQSLTSEKSVVVDAFAGTGVVGFNLQKANKVIANDIQKYSYLINKNILSAKLLDLIDGFSVDSLTDSKTYVDNKEYLSALFKKPLSVEANVLADQDYEKLALLVNNQLFYDGTNFRNEENNKQHEFISKTYTDVLSLFSKKQIDNLKADSQWYMLFTLYYSNGYFSLRQAIQIDSLRKVISEIDNETTRDFALMLLLHAVSEATSSVGKQFAQPTKVTNKAGEIKIPAAKRTIKNWKIDIVDEMNSYLEQLRLIPVRNRSDNEVFNLDVISLINQLEKKPNEEYVFYLDPPYTIDHYSRFYHVLEVLIEYDYPDLDSKMMNGERVLMNGRYASERFQSDFSIRSKALDTFDEMFRKIAKLGGKVVLSYSDADDDGRKRVVTKAELTELLSKYFSSVKVTELLHDYRKLNAEEKNVSASSTHELIFLVE